MPGRPREWAVSRACLGVREIEQSLCHRSASRRRGPMGRGGFPTGRVLAAHHDDEWERYSVRLVRSACRLSGAMCRLSIRLRSVLVRDPRTVACSNRRWVSGRSLGQRSRSTASRESCRGEGRIRQGPEADVASRPCGRTPLQMSTLWESCATTGSTPRVNDSRLRAHSSLGRNTCQRIK